MNNQFPNDINRTQSLQDSNKDNRIGSKNASGMEEIVNNIIIYNIKLFLQNFGNENGEANDYINSYNYYIYYNSMKPKNENLPKPTYEPSQKLDFMNQPNQHSEINNLSDMMNNLSLEQMNYDNNSNFSPFNMNNDQIIIK